MPQMNIPLEIEGFLKIYDPNSMEIFVDKHNAIHYENMSVAIAQTLSNRSFGNIFKMSFGNGGSSVDETGVITYLPPNVTGINSALYNQTFSKIVDDTNISNLNPARNKMSINHTSGKVYTDILIQCLLDYSEPAGQLAFDNGTQMESPFVFDELGLLAFNGTDSLGNELSKLLTHVVFHPVQKSLNRQIQIDYTIRIQTLTNLVTT
jgi:hypothetical protein